MKKIFDITVAILFIFVLSPLLLLFSVLIKLDSKGPIFFKQARVGRNGKNFWIYKYRTMVENAESIGSGIYTSKTDARITRVGKLLRKTSLDELPQLFNIIKGEMSFVGPRPPVPYHPRKYTEYTELQKKRFTVLPGITGLAQIKGRNMLTWDERIIIDVEYVEKQTLILDLKIILLTILSVLTNKNIYSGRN